MTDPESTIDDIAAALAEDFDLLAHLHDCEVSADTLQGLRRHRLQDWFGLRLRRPAGKAALGALDRALADLPAEIDAATLDDLAADYADIYLTYRYRTAPSESVWFDDDGLERQATAFAVRDWYLQAGVAPNDPQKRPDDHLVLQLRFASHLCRLNGATALVEAGRFLDQHLLRWVDRFCADVSSQCLTPFYAALAETTAAHLDEARDLIATATGAAREVAPQPEPKPVELPEEPAAYTPATGPSW